MVWDFSHSPLPQPSTQEVTKLLQNLFSVSAEVFPPCLPSCSSLCLARASLYPQKVIYHCPAGSHSAAIAGSRGSQAGDTVFFSLLGGQREQRRNQGWARSAAHPRAAVRAPEALGKGKCWLGLCSSLGTSLSPQGLWSTGTQLFPFPAGQGWLSRVLEHLRGVPRGWE